MGTRGPVPKSDATRAGHRAKSERAKLLKRSSDVVVTEPREEWCDRAREQFDLASLSTVAQEWDSSDWGALLLMCDILDTHYTSARPSAEMYKHAMAIHSRLLLTPADRLRNKRELSTNHNEDDDTTEGDDDVLKRFAALRTGDGAG